MDKKGCLILSFSILVSISSCKKTEQYVAWQGKNTLDKVIIADYLITGGLVYDGSLNDASVLDIAIKSDTIVFVGNANECIFDVQKIIKADGYIVTPGFIDPHTHTESNFNSTDVETRANLRYLRQGVTTVLTGNDGYGLVDVKSQLSKWKNSGIGTNVGVFVGFGEVRKTVLGTNNVQPNGLQLAQMKEIVGKAMRDGAFGLSTGLSYIPQSYSLRTGTELKELAKATQPYGGVYDSHIRNQGSGSIDAIREVEEISQYANNLRVNISHIKVTPKLNYGLVDDIINYIKLSREKGIPITANVYPYLASSDGLSSILPTSYRTSQEVYNDKYNNLTSKATMINTINSYFIDLGGSIDEGAKLKLIVDANPLWKGKTIYEIAQQKGISPANTVLDMLYTKISISVISFNQSEQVVEKFMKEPFITTGSDGTNTHPRGSGTFPEAIKKYSINQGVQTLKEAIHKSSALTAEIFGIKNRGILKTGNYADILVLDIDNYKANSTYLEPSLLATGVKCVFLNGKLVVENDIYKGILAGVILKKN